MINVSELRRLIANELRQIGDIEEIFDALVAYPEGQGFENATRADLAGAMEAACASLVGDTRRMPEETRFTLLSVAAGARVEMPAGDGISYGWGAAVVEEALASFVQRLGA
jgi:hypothetical protein